MAKFLWSILLFIFFSGLFYLAMLLAWGSAMPQRLKPNLNYNVGAYGHSYTRFEEIKSVRQPDVLFLGSSHAYRGFDPRNFKKANLDVFNLGSSSQTPAQTKVLLDRYLDQVDPKTIVYEVYPGTFCNDGIESSIDIISNDGNDINTLLMTAQTRHIKTINTFLYASMRTITQTGPDYSEPVTIGKDTYITGGFVEREMEYYQPEKSGLRQWYFNSEQFYTFGKIVNEIKKRNIALILVFAPITKTTYESYINNNVFDTIMEHFGVPYYNFNETMNLKDTLHFYDSHHLNQAGVNIFNQEVLRILP